MQRGRRVDANQGIIVNALRASGARVVITSAVGSMGGNLAGFPDIVIGYAGRTILGEIKTSKGKLTSAEQTFVDTWSLSGDDYVVLRSVDDALALINRLQ